LNLPTDIANQSLDACGLDFTLGDIEDGTRPAQVTLRHYNQCLRQLLRAAHWDMARKQVPLVLLADATGNTPNVGTIVADSAFLYQYQYPIDCMKVRFVPWNPFQNPGAPQGNIVPPNNSAPITPGSGFQTQPAAGMRLRPARFLIGTDTNYPVPPGSSSWETQGTSPNARTVIMTNVRNATCVYTCLQLYPSLWDAQFRAALVSYLASEICLPLHQDKKFALALRPQLIASAKEKIAQARITDGNEGHYSSDIKVDWIQDRNAGAASGMGFWAPGWGGEGPGVWGYGWDSASFADGSAY
jgi:hypothetical protein